MECLPRASESTKHSVISIYLPNTGEWPFVFCVFVRFNMVVKYCCYIFTDEKAGVRRD